MFTKKDNSGYKTPIDGIEMKTIAYGEKTLMTEFRLKENSTLPSHSHHHEQTGYLVSGHIKLIIGGKFTTPSRETPGAYRRASITAPKLSKIQ